MRDTHYPIPLRKLLSSTNPSLRFAVLRAVKHRNNEPGKTFSQELLNFKADIASAPYHIFGDHSKCDSYYCKFNNVTGGEVGEVEEYKNYVPDFRSCFLFDKLLQNKTRIVSIVLLFPKTKGLNYYGIYNVLTHHT